MDWQKYLPWIIGAAIVLFVLSRLRQRTVLAPQTQITRTPQPDPYLEARTGAFTSLVELAGVISAQDTAKTVALARENTQLMIANRSFDTDISLAEINARVAQTLANFNLLSRNQDRQLQQSAIDRYYSSRSLDNIVGSVSTALSSIFGNRSGSGSIFRGTPPTFPGFQF